MTLPDGYIDVPAGKMANVVTCLEMTQPPPPRPDPPGIAYGLVRIASPGADWYRALFRRVGEPYLWGSRLAMRDEELLRVVRDPRVEVYAVRGAGGEEAGLLELDFRAEDECELKFFGLAQDAIGKGAGRWLMNRALERAWSRRIRRMWVHTCTLDHPGIVPFYIRSGFVPFKRQIEIGDDPRAVGLLSKSAAPEVPIIPPLSS